MEDALAVAPPARREPDGMGHIVAAAAYSEGRRVADIPLAEGRAWAEKPRHFVWIGMVDPRPDELDDLRRQFGLHELAIEDALQAHQHPKIEAYGDSLFIVLRTAHRQGSCVAFGETHIFVGQGYVISVRHGPSSSYAAVRAKLEASPTFLRHGEDYVLHAILDFVVDNYLPVLEAIEAEVTAMEDHVLRKGLSRTRITAIHGLRRELRQLRRVAGPTAEICRRLQHINVPFIDKAVRPYFRDVRDHVQRVNEGIELATEMLDNSFETGLLLESSHQNDIGRKFAAWAAILAVPTAVAGIYGMNFQDMPELAWHYGYPVTLLLILTVCVGLWARFKQVGWL